MGSDEEPEEHNAQDGADCGADCSADGTSEAGESPAWADGLKQLYRSVVDEPLPDSFQNLLDQFDEDGGDGDGDPEHPA